MLRALHHDRVHDDRLAPAADHLAGHSVLRRRRAEIDLPPGLGYPKKADDARRNPKVALLFSDPTGSGVDCGSHGLVQGIAHVDEDDLDANAERYMRDSVDQAPGDQEDAPAQVHARAVQLVLRADLRPRASRARLLWPDGDPTRAPQMLDSHIDEVRSGHAEEPPEPHAPATGGEVAWDSRISELGRRHPMAVLSWVGPDGFPLSVRVPVALDATTAGSAIGATRPGCRSREGRACLTAHAHAEDFTWQENFQVRGDLVDLGPERGWALMPARLVGGFELPKGFGRTKSFASRHWRSYKTAKKRMAARGTLS